ncbi:hypothetical protein DENSPDRAFT_431747 [Dentipellis sp. KUC8613]|nr:hypothetical protein DENSPDRAFT_431747 [Dentipellis sp. KUC8613]
MSRCAHAAQGFCSELTGLEANLNSAHARTESLLECYLPAVLRQSAGMICDCQGLHMTFRSQAVSRQHEIMDRPGACPERTNSFLYPGSSAIQCSLLARPCDSTRLLLLGRIARARAYASRHILMSTTRLRGAIYNRYITQKFASRPAVWADDSSRLHRAPHSSPNAVCHQAPVFIMTLAIPTPKGHVLDNGQWGNPLSRPTVTLTRTARCLTSKQLIPAPP